MLIWCTLGVFSRGDADIISDREIKISDAEVAAILAQARQRYILTPEQARRLREFGNESEGLGAIRKAEDAVSFLPEEEKASFLAGRMRLAEIPPPKRSREYLSLIDVMQPLFAQAWARVADGRSAQAESRAAFLALASYMAKVDPVTVLGEAGKDIPPCQVDRALVRLAHRRDLAQHFAVAAALSLTVGPDEADRIGLAKELDDLRHGSGFSFRDLAANRAGIRLAVAASASEQEARRIVKELAGLARESDIMPSVLGLVDGLHEMEFYNHYQHAGSARFDRTITAINEKIDALPIYAGSD